MDHGEVEKALEKGIRRNEDLIELEVRSLLRQNALQREQLISREMESFKIFEGKSVTKRRSKLGLELDNLQEQLNELCRSEPVEERQKKFHQWVIGNDLPDGYEFLAIIFPPTTIQLPPFLPVGAELGVNIFWKIPAEYKSEK